MWCAANEKLPFRRKKDIDTGFWCSKLCVALFCGSCLVSVAGDGARNHHKRSLGMRREQVTIKQEGILLESDGMNCNRRQPQSVDVHKLVTIVVSSSPRSQDSSGESSEILMTVLQSAWDVLNLRGSQTIVAFDGRHPDLDDNVWQNYQRQIKQFQETIKHRNWNWVKVFENPDWTHQAVMLRRVAAKWTSPFVFLMQDDSQVLGSIDTPFILYSLRCDREVDYVKFLWHDDCIKDDGSYNTWYETDPCTPHASNKLQRTLVYSDRPHFATTNFYTLKVFPRIPPNSKHTPEQIFEHAFGMDGHMWLYGTRKHMLHDKNLLGGSFNVRN